MSTAAIEVEGVLTLGLDTGFDLDMGAPGPVGEDDLRQEMAEGNGPVLAPVNGATIGVASQGAGPVTRELCVMSLLSESSLPLSGLLVGDILCFRTNRGRIGTLTITAIGDPLTADFTTWSP
jgi:hypothetical protein